MAGYMQLEDWLDDLCVRFIINLPEEDLSSVARICFQVEEAQWFYEDFIRPLDPTLPSMTLRTFCLRIFQHCPLLAHFSVENHTQAFEQFLEYKTRVPVRGAIVLNRDLDSMVLVKGWKKGATWTFPGGKINKDEDDLDCAIREVWEETGLDLRAAGLVPTTSKPKYFEIPIRNHQVRLYVFRDCPMDYNFQPQTRKEISRVEWYKLSELPSFRKKNGQGNANGNEQAASTNSNKFYMIAPFMTPLKKWVGTQKRNEQKLAASALHPMTQLTHTPIEEVPSESDAWVQPEVEAHAPLVKETLGAATLELQRLLKMQAPTQGTEMPTYNKEADKGSALLSILQAKNSSGTRSAINSQLPRTPLSHNSNQPPPPHNPHHHTNSQPLPLGPHQAPPVFALGTHNAGAAWHPPQQLSMPSTHVDYHGQHSAPYHAHGSQQHTAFPATTEHHLSNRSQALLNAFTRAPQVNQHPQQSRATPSAAAPPSEMHPQFQNALSAHGLIPESQSVATAVAPALHRASDGSVIETAKAAPGDQHKSALLGMFTKSPATETPPPHNYSSPLNQPAKAPAPVTLRSRPADRAESRNSNPYQATDGVNQATLEKRMAHLALFSRSDGTVATGSHAKPAQGHQNPQSGPSASPVRILKRGEPNIPSNPYPHSPHAAEGSGPSGRRSAQGLSPEAAGGKSDQKRQLLSLFGAQSPAQPLMESGTSSNNRVSPAFARREETLPKSPLPDRRGSRPGTETPMSPADQSFLLDYLQSVTKTVL